MIYLETNNHSKRGRLFKFMCGVLDSVDKFFLSTDSKI